MSFLIRINQTLDVGAKTCVGLVVPIRLSADTTGWLTSRDTSIAAVRLLDYMSCRLEGFSITFRKQREISETEVLSEGGLPLSVMQTKLNLPVYVNTDLHVPSGSQFIQDRVAPLSFANTKVTSKASGGLLLYRYRLPINWKAKGSLRHPQDFFVASGDSYVFSETTLKALVERNCPFGYTSESNLQVPDALYFAVTDVPLGLAGGPSERREWYNLTFDLGINIYFRGFSRNNEF